MKKKPMLVLLIEDEPFYAKLVHEIIKDARDASFDLIHVQSLKAGSDCVAKEVIAIFVLDLMLPDSSGLETFSKLKKKAKDIPVVIISSLDDEEIAVNALKMGAEDYLFKVDVKPNNLVRTLRYAVERKRAHEEIHRSSEKLRALFSGFPLPSFTWQYSGDDFILVDYNKAALEVTDGKISELIDIKARDLYSDKPEIVDDILRCYTKSIIIRKNYEYHYQTTEKIRFLAVTMVPTPPESVFVFTEDSTERKGAEAELKRARDELEMKVKERTAELSETNEKLEGEIEERKQAEETLRFLNLAIEQSSEGIATTDLEGNLLFVNNAIASMHGYSVDELAGQHLSIFHNAQQLPAVEAANREIAETGKFKGEILNCRRDGSVFPTLMNNSIIHDTDGNAIGMLGSIRDITDQKLAEEKLYNSEERFKSLSDASFEAIFVSEKGVCIDQNQTAERMFGYTASEAVGKKGTEWIAPEDREEVMNKMLSGYEAQYEITALRKDGTTFPAEIQARMAYFQNRQVRITALNDITKRKKAEEALRESEEKWRGLFENSIEAAFIVDVKGNLKSVNRALEMLLGTDREELIGINFLEYMKPKMAKEILEAYNHLYRTNEPIKDLTYDIIRKDGKERTVEGYVNVIKKENKVIGFQGMLRDITERKRVEESLRIRDWAVHSSISAIIIIDLDGIITYANPSFVKMSGYDDVSDIVGMSLMEFWQEERKISEILDYLRSTESWVGELVAKKKDHSFIDVQLSVSIVKNEKGKPISIMGFLVDITERKKLEEDLWILSITDSLTGLYNQRHFYKKIEEELVRARRMSYPICLMILDLDNFKKYNDRYGHLKGDDVLRKIGGIIKKTIRKKIDSAFRYGGDEFAVILPNAKKEVAFKVAKRIKNTVNKRFDDESIGISFGIELLTDNLNVEDFVRAADVAMYKDKRVKEVER